MKFLKCSENAIPPPTGKRVAIVGAGPAGLGAAGVLRCKGHEVHVYDALQEPGGMLIFAIPEYHVPKAGVRSGVQELVKAGVNFHMKTKVAGCSGDGVKLEDLVRDFDAVLIATGTWRSRNLGVPGEDLPGVYVALDWLFEFYQAQLGYTSMDEVPPLGRNIMVVGGGLTAVDATEVPLRYLKDRFNIQKVYLSYRRTRNEAPMSPREFNRLIEKYGVEPLELTVPTKFSPGPDGRVASTTLQRMKLESVPGDKRPHPVPIPGSEFEVKVDAVLVAAGEIPSPPFEQGCLGIELNRDGTIKTDQKFRTTAKKVFAAGDVRHGASLYGLALKSGNEAAAALDEFLRTGSWS
ncbi:MAG: FAD-dependent oxidoreductase [Conexivisphaera sp.]|jgi:glutamate synthase (NADPH/NADH) small chain